MALTVQTITYDFNTGAQGWSFVQGVQPLGIGTAQNGRLEVTHANGWFEWGGGRWQIIFSTPIYYTATSRVTFDCGQSAGYPAFGELEVFFGDPATLPGDNDDANAAGSGVTSVDLSLGHRAGEQLFRVDVDMATYDQGAGAPTYWFDNVVLHDFLTEEPPELPAIRTHAVAMPNVADGASRGEPMPGDRAAWDAANYAERHTNDTDTETGIHWTKTEIESMAVAGSRIQTVASDGAWCWFSDPRAVYYNGKTYYSYIDSAGNILIRSYNHIARAFSAAATLHEALEVDDHDNPAILIRDSDKKLLAFYSKHFGTELYLRISSSPESADGWAAETNLFASTGARKVTYAQPVQLTGETNSPIYLLFRNHYTDDNAEWAYTKSSDGGATWGSMVSVFRFPTSGYVKIVESGGDRIDFVASEHPNYSASNVYHFYYQGGNYYQSDGTQITASLPLAPSDVTKVYDGAAVKSWIWDIAIDPAGNPVIVYATFESTADHRYNYARWTGSAWDAHEITAAGGGLYSPEVYYSGGVVLDHTDPTLVWLSKVVGSQYEIFRGKTTDDGASWTLTAITSGSSSKQIRPAPVLNHHADIAALWMSGTYTTYINYDTAIMAVGEWEASASGAGDMLKSTYDADNNGVVDNSAGLEGHPASYFATADHTHAGGASGEVLMADGEATATPLANEEDSDWIYEG